VRGAVKKGGWGGLPCGGGEKSAVAVGGGGVRGRGGVEDVRQKWPVECNTGCDVGH